MWFCVPIECHPHFHSQPPQAKWEVRGEKGAGGKRWQGRGTTSRTSIGAAQTTPQATGVSWGSGGKKRTKEGVGLQGHQKQEGPDGAKKGSQAGGASHRLHGQGRGGHVWANRPSCGTRARQGGRHICRGGQAEATRRKSTCASTISSTSRTTLSRTPWTCSSWVLPQAP